MTYHWLIPLLAAVANLVLAVLVFRSGRQTAAARIFVLLATLLVCWNLNFFVLDSAHDRILAFELTWYLRMGSVFVPAASLHLILALKPDRSKVWNTILLIDYTVAFALAVANGFNLVVASLRPVAWGYSSVQGPLYGTFSLSVMANFLGSLFLLVHDFRTTDDPRLKVQLRFWLLGAAVAMPLGLTNLLPAYGIPIFPLGNLGNTMWAGVVAYAIVKHRLLDVDVVVTKGVAYVASGLFVITPAFALAVVMQARVFGTIHYDFSFALLVMFVAIGVLFPTLRVRTEAQVERSFFRAKHEYRSVLASFAKSVIRILDRERLIREVAEKLSGALRVDRIAIFMRQDNGEGYDLRFNIGAPPLLDMYFASDLVLRTLTRSGEAVLREEAEARPELEWKTAAQLLAANAWEVCVPLAASGNLVGFMGLGRKRDLDVFSVIDLDLLGTIAAQSAIALENSRLYEELHKSRDIIQRADRMSALGTLAAGIAHEIRNPLVSIQTFFQLAPDRLDDEEFVTSFMALAETEVKRIADLVNELLAFARSHPDTIQEIDLDDTINRTVKLLSPQAHQHRVQLRRIGEHELPIIRIDPDRIKQVLINIILNGIQATPEGGIVTVLTRMVEQRGRQFCQIEISDTGVGISTSMQEDIFNPFFTTKDEGTGLGLSIAHQIIGDHGGFIALESKEGEGSKFLIHLPVSDALAAVDGREHSRMAG